MFIWIVCFIVGVERERGRKREAHCVLYRVLSSLTHSLIQIIIKTQANAPERPNEIPSISI